MAAVNDDDDPFKSLRKDHEKLHNLDNDAIQPNLSAESFAGLDSAVVTSASFSNDGDVIAEVIEGENGDSKDDQDDEESTPQRILQLIKLKTSWKRCKTFRAGTKFVPLYWTWKAC